MNMNRRGHRSQDFGTVMIGEGSSWLAPCELVSAWVAGVRGSEKSRLGLWFWLGTVETVSEKLTCSCGTYKLGVLIVSD